MRKKCAYLHTRSTGHDMADISHPAISTRKKKIIVFDTETTGLLPYDRIITIGAVRIEGDELLNQPLYLILILEKTAHRKLKRFTVSTIG